MRTQNIKSGWQTQCLKRISETFDIGRRRGDVVRRCALCKDRIFARNHQRKWKGRLCYLDAGCILLLEEKGILIRKVGINQINVNTMFRIDEEEEKTEETKETE